MYSGVVLLGTRFLYGPGMILGGPVCGLVDRVRARARAWVRARLGENYVVWEKIRFDKSIIDLLYTNLKLPVFKKCTAGWCYLVPDSCMTPGGLRCGSTALLGNEGCAWKLDLWNLILYIWKYFQKGWSMN